jgi:hypothetical protein
LIYKVLDAVFLKSDIRTKAQVGRELSMCEMALGESLQDFIARINDLMEESQMMGEPITDNQRMITLATRLRDPWHEVADNLIDREPELTYTLLMQHLMQKLCSDPEGRRSNMAFVSTTSVGNRERGGGQSNGGREGSWRKDGREEGRMRSAGFGREDNWRERSGEGNSRGGGAAADVCFNCGERGHWRRFCPKPPKCGLCGQIGHASRQCGSRVREQTNRAMISVEQEGWRSRNYEGKEEHKGEEFAYMANRWHGCPEKGVFLLDGAATTHMVKEYVFLENERPVKMMVKGLGELQSVGKGILEIQGVVLGEALRVPGLKFKLISEGIMQRQGCRIVSQHGWRKLFDDRGLLLEARLVRGLFIWKPEGVRMVKNGNLLARTCKRVGVDTLKYNKGKEKLHYEHKQDLADHTIGSGDQGRQWQGNLSKHGSLLVDNSAFGEFSADFSGLQQKQEQVAGNRKGIINSEFQSKSKELATKGVGHDNKVEHGAGNGAKVDVARELVVIS